MEPLNLLLDTNILIPLEDTGRALPSDLAEIKRLCAEFRHQLCIHPDQREDIAQDRDERRKAIVESRVDQYPEIPNPPTLSENEIENFEWREINRNDKVDNRLLAALSRGAVDYLVSEDRGIHKKAKKALLSERVFRIPQLLQFLRRQGEKELQAPVGIEDKYIHEFDVNDPFFDSLRLGYEGFNSWWRKCSREHRKVWCVHDAGRPLAVCVYKVEESNSIAEGQAPLVGDHLKICTFKVGPEIRGLRIGERLLHTAFSHATHHGIPWVYLHADASKHKQLIDLCEDYGFENYGFYGDDIVYIKSMVPPSGLPNISPIEFATKYHPHFIDNDYVSKFFVPIKPPFHEKLFPDISDSHEGVFPAFFQPGSAGNTIKKAYICRSNIKKIHSGDLLLFYRSKDRKSIEVIGVVEKAEHVTDIVALNKLVSKRTVYSSDELIEQIEKKCLVVLFRTMCTFNAIELEKIRSCGITPSQTISEISNAQYAQLNGENHE